VLINGALSAIKKQRGSNKEIIMTAIDVRIETLNYE